MARKAKAVQIDVTETPKGFKKSIGYWTAKDGTRKPKVFMLGHDRSDALEKAAILVGFHKHQKSIGKDTWTDQSLKQAAMLIHAKHNNEVGRQLEAIREQADIASKSFNTNSDAFPLIGQPRTPTNGASFTRSEGIATGDTSTLMLYAAMQLWLDHLESRVKGNDLSDSYWKRNITSMNDLKKAIDDTPIESLTIEDLQSIKFYFQARPTTNKGTPMAWATITTTLNHGRAFFRWLSDTDKWNELKRWERALQPKQTGDSADDETNIEFSTYTLDELAKLYAVATDHTKLMLLTGLNCAFGSKEIATLKKVHFKTFDGQVRICRHRHKKAGKGKPVYGEWDLWNETWKLAKARMAVTSNDPTVNPNGRAYLGKNDLELVHPTPSGRVDSIALAFADLCVTAKVKNHGWYAIRRTGGQMIDRIAGEPIADLMLSHRPKSVTKKFYVNADFQKLHAALKVMRQQLQPMFDAKADSQHQTDDKAA